MNEISKRLKVMGIFSAFVYVSWNLMLIHVRTKVFHLMELFRECMFMLFFIFFYFSKLADYIYPHTTISSVFNHFFEHVMITLYQIG